MVIFRSNNCIEYEGNGNRNQTPSVEEYLNKIRSYIKYIINNLKKSDTWKIQLTTAINFMSSKVTKEELAMYWTSDNIEIIINDKPDEVIEEFFKLLFSRYQIGFETSTKGADFIFDCVHFLYNKYNKIYPVVVDHT